MGIKGGTRAGLLALAGGYVLYLAWEMYADLRDGKTEMTPGLTIAFISFFAVAGIAVIVYAARIWIRSRKGEETEDEQKEGNTNSLK